MDREEAFRRDGVLRAWFAGRDWCRSPEYVLARELVLAGSMKDQGFPFLVDYEWEVSVEGYTQLGRGDLVFCDGERSFAVVEVKFVEGGRLGGSDKNRRTHMREKRRKVEEQAVKYAEAFLGQNPGIDGVSLFLLTNLGGLHPYGRVKPEDEVAERPVDQAEMEDEGEE